MAVLSRDSTAEIFFHAVALCAGQCGKTWDERAFGKCPNHTMFKVYAGMFRYFWKSSEKDGKSAMRIQSPSDNRLAKPESRARERKCSI